MPEVVSGKASRQHQPGLIIGGLLAMAVLLGVSAAAGWRYINDVPPFAPQLPPMPVPNGYDRAEKVLNSGSSLIGTWNPLARSRRTVPPNWPHGTAEQLQAALVPERSKMNQVRAAMRLEW